MTASKAGYNRGLEFGAISGKNDYISISISELLETSYPKTLISQFRGLKHSADI